VKPKERTRGFPPFLEAFLVFQKPRTGAPLSLAAGLLVVLFVIRSPQPCRDFLTTFFYITKQSESAPHI
jgi:hypothetical protein